VGIGSNFSLALIFLAFCVLADDGSIWCWGYNICILHTGGLIPSFTAVGSQ